MDRRVGGDEVIQRGERKEEKNRHLVPSPPGRAFPFLSLKMINLEKCGIPLWLVCVCLSVCACVPVSVCECIYRTHLVVLKSSALVNTSKC